MKISKESILLLIATVIFSVSFNLKLQGNLKGRRQRIQRPRPEKQRGGVPIKSRRVPRWLQEHPQIQNNVVASNIDTKKKIEQEKNRTTDKIKSQSPSKLILKGYIQSTDSMKNVPTFKILFGGKQTTNDSEGFYSIPTENTNFEKYYILICSKINQNFSGVNTIENLSINPGKNYRFFSCKKTLDEKKNEHWILKEKTLDKKQFKLPHNCIICLINPKYVQNIAEWKIKLLDGFLPIPKIVLNEYTPQRKLKNRSAKSLLYSLDNRLFHENIERQTKEFEDKPNLKVSLDQ